MTKFPAMVLGIGGVLGTIADAVGLESLLSNAVGGVSSMPAGDLLAVTGGVSIAVAQLFGMSLNGIARKKFGVPHPISVPTDLKKEDQVAFFNAG